MIGIGPFFLILSVECTLDFYREGAPTGFLMRRHNRYHQSSPAASFTQPIARAEKEKAKFSLLYR